MPTDTQHDLREFHTWLGGQLNNGGGRLTIEESITEFRAYQEELERCRAEIRIGLEESLRGESEAFDVDDIMRGVDEELQRRNISL